MKTNIQARAVTVVPSTGDIQLHKLHVKARNENQGLYIEEMKNNDMTFGIGPAGTGKTWLAVAFAAAALEKGVVERIIITRPAVEAGEKLGFLPGDLKEKVDPYLRPIYDALYDVMEAADVEKHMLAGAIEIAPLAFMRGRTLTNAVAILDEAQNTTAMQMKMFLTRMGEGTKMLITGDPTQNDLPKNQISGLTDAFNTLQGIEGIAFRKFDDEDIVRHPLVAAIVRRYEEKAAAPRP